MAELSWAEALVAAVGRFGADRPEPPWIGHDDPDGLLARQALIDSSPAVAAFHAERGVPTEVSVATLADLDEQVRVHREAYGRFGLHTQDWLALIWSGALYGLGRLQFELLPDPLVATPAEPVEAWVLSVHIPATGPLDPDAVDESFAAARDFFPRHFPDYPIRSFFCRSWLLDPELPARLPGTNLAAFQQRWTLEGEPRTGEVDTLFFVFRRRGQVDLDSLPTRTRLERATVEALRTRGGWHICEGRIAW